MSYLLESLSMGILAATAPSPHNIKLGLMSIEQDRKEKILAFCLGALALDLLIIALSIVFGGLNGSKATFTRILRVAGSLFYLYLAFKIIRKRQVPATAGSKLKVRKSSRGFVRGMLVQSCNPNPFLFWFLVGGPRVVDLATQAKGQMLTPAIYILTFLTCTYGVKFAMALSLNKFLGSSIMRSSNFSRMIFASVLILLAIQNVSI